MVFRAAIFAVLTVLTGFVPVQAAEAFKEFTFRTVKPPKAGAKKLINIQIVPDAPKPADEKPAPQVVASAPSDQVSWFWDGISPDLAAAGAGRFQDAVLQLARAPQGKAIATPRIDQFRQIIADHGSTILLSTIGTKLSPALVLAMISTESGGKVGATSKAGATGLMQLMPDTAARFGVTDISDPVQNINGGVAYMEWLLARFGNDPILALAAYNAGETAIANNNGVPPYGETRAYVPKVIAAFQVARVLCLTPPELFSDGCVFDLKGGN